MSVNCGNGNLNGAEIARPSLFTKWAERDKK